MTQPATKQAPIQAVERPILCGPYDAPKLHWHYDKVTGMASKTAGRRPSRYWYKTKDDVAGQLTLEMNEGQDDLAKVNQLREDVARWRESNYEGVTPITRELLRYWASPERSRRLFFCQREAVETVVYLAEILRGGKRPRFTPMFQAAELKTLVDTPANPDYLPLTRFGCKMATGSGKTVVMSMLIAWAFCNRGRNPGDERFANAALVCCPNLTVKERLQVLRPERPDNYYAAFDIVPVKLRPLMQNGKVIVENWHTFALESPHAEGGTTSKVVNKGIETPEAFAKRVLGDLYDRLPVMVLNDEAHHCYRPKPLEEKLAGEEAKDAAEEREEATVWIEGLDRINNHAGGIAAGPKQPGVSLCVDLSATPFYLHGSGYTEGSPFPWLVSDFGLVDAIESGIVKIPRLPVSDTTGLPEAAYFKLWETIRERLMKSGSAEFLPGRAKKPKPESVYREAEPALKQLAGQWAERFKLIESAKPGQVQTPPVLILVCDNVDIAEVFYRKISGEEPIEAATLEDVEAVEAEEAGEQESPAKARGKGTARAKVSYGHGLVFPTLLANAPAVKHTIRIDTDLLSKAESADPNQSRKDAGEALRRVVASVGKRGEPGEHVRCVVSVSMLTEGWDANNVTQIMGIRAFRSQLLCEQVVGRGLRRMDYTPDPETGLLKEEYVDVYGIPFSVIPYKGRPVGQPEPNDTPDNHVKALPERAGLEMRYPVVEGYAFAMKRNRIKCDVGKMDVVAIESNNEPTATFLLPTVGYQEGRPTQTSPFKYEKQDRQAYYKATHLQGIQFQIAHEVVTRLSQQAGAGGTAKARVAGLQARHLLFPQVLRIVREFVARKVDFRDENPCELGMEKYVERIVENLGASIRADDDEGDPPLLPILNRYKPMGTTADVGFTTKRPVHGTHKSHINQVVLDTLTWESTVAFRLEASEAVVSYARNDHLDLVIPYVFQGVDHYYQPDFIVRLSNGVNVLLEVKGFEDAQTAAKHEAAKKWVDAVNNAKEHGRWVFHVCRDPRTVERQLQYLLETTAHTSVR